MSKKKSKRSQAKSSKRKAAHSKKRNVKRQDPAARERARVHEKQTQLLRATGEHADWGKHTDDIFRDQKRLESRKNRGADIFID